MYTRPSNPAIPKGDPDDPHGLTKHHRKPRCLGGTDDPRNISYPPRYKHAAWHALYQNLPAEQSIHLFLIDYELLGMDVRKSTTTAELHGKYINRDGSRIKRRDNWRILFDNKTSEEIIGEINTMWLDPDYQLVVRTERNIVIGYSSKNNTSVPSEHYKGVHNA